MRKMVVMFGSALAGGLAMAVTNTWLYTGTTDWNTDANWKLQTVPTAADVAQFPYCDKTANHVLSSDASVSGLNFSAIYNAWRIFSGSGKLTVGADGLVVQATMNYQMEFKNAFAFLGDQSWQLTRSDNSLRPATIAFGGPLDFAGDLSISAPWACKNPVTLTFGYSTGMAPDVVSIAGALSLHGHVEFQTYLLPAAGAADYAFGGTVAEPSTMTLDGVLPRLTVNAFAGDGTRARLVNPIDIRGEKTVFSVWGTASAFEFAGDLTLAGPLALLNPNSANPSMTFSGTTFLDLSTAGTRAIYTQPPGYNQKAVGFDGVISDGTGAFATPLVFSAVNQPFTVGGDSDYSVGTVVDFCGAEYNSEAARGRIAVSASGSLGTGEVSVLPGGRLSLGAATCVDGTKPIRLRSNTVADAVVANVHDALPSVTADSRGVVGVDGTYTGDIDLTAIGNGTCAIGTTSGGTLNGANPIVPQTDGTIRFGGGGGDGIPTLTLNKVGQLARATKLQVGSPKWHGNANVYVPCDNAFTGTIDVTGIACFDRDGATSRTGLGLFGSQLKFNSLSGEKSALGDTAGKIALHGSCLHYNAKDSNATDTKAELEVEGYSRIILNHNIHPSTLVLGKLTRLNRGTLGLWPQRQMLGTNEKLEIVDRSIVKNGIFPGWFVDNRNGKFLTWDDTKTTIDYATTASASATSDPTAVLELSAQTISSDIACYGVRLDASIGGSGRLSVGEGGVIVALGKMTFAPTLDFGTNEGVIFAYQGSSSFNGPIAGSNGLTIFGNEYVTSTADNTFTGQLTLNGVRFNVALDEEDAVHGLGPLTNPILLNGASVGTSTSATLLRAERTITIGENGCMFAGTLTLASRLRGEGLLQCFNGTLTVSNPDNDYAGGTFLLSGIGNGNSGSLVATSAAKLGTGDLVVNNDTSATLQGDANLAAGAEVQVALGGTVAFTSANPAIGSLAGAGKVTLGTAESASELTVGTGNASGVFYGSIGELSAGCSLRKTGTGAFTLYGRHTFTGGVTVEAGEFCLRGEIAGPLEVGENATLAAELGADGKVAASKVAGDVTVAGAVTLNLPDGLKLDGGSVYELASFTGSADLSKATAPAGFRLLARDGKLALRVQSRGLNVFVR